jgi:hypothetical protein
MPDYAITGKKGNGKSLVAVARIQDYLKKGLPVATNLDLKLHNLVGKDNKTARVIRIPDHPTGADLAILGVANKTPNEELNGILVLDEMAIWSNSRDFKAANRQTLIDWLVQARKDGWDCYYLVQEINMVDKQIREGLFEHVVQCRRMDRLTIPILNGLSKFFLGRKASMPRVHIGFVRYGDGGSASLVVDRWVYRGTQYFSSYNTKQKFRSDYPHGPFSYLPPWFTHGRFRTSFSKANIMRLTKILWRKHSRPFFFLAGLSLASVLLLAVFLRGAETQAEPINIDMLDKLRSASIISYINLPGRVPRHILKYSDNSEVSSDELLNMGYVLTDFSRNAVTVSKGGQSVVINR